MPISVLSAPHFHHEQAAYGYVEARLWPDGPPRADLPQAAEPIAMLCQGQTCSLPVTTPEALSDAIGERRLPGVVSRRS